MNYNHVGLLTGKGAKKVLKYLIRKLDELDEEDALGPEGWRKRLDMDGASDAED